MGVMVASGFELIPAGERLASYERGKIKSGSKKCEVECVYV